MGKAVKKPIEIKYMTFEDVINDYHQNKLGEATELEWWKINHEVGESIFTIETLEGNMIMSDSDVLIIGVRGEMYPCKIDIFNETYKIIKEVL